MNTRHCRHLIFSVPVLGAMLAHPSAADDVATGKLPRPVLAYLTPAEDKTFELMRYLIDGSDLGGDGLDAGDIKAVQVADWAEARTNALAEIMKRDLDGD